jgi:endoglucanase Acf2
LPRAIAEPAGEPTAEDVDFIFAVKAWMVLGENSEFPDAGAIMLWTGDF